MSGEFNPGNRHDVESFNWQSASGEAGGGIQVARIGRDIARSLFAGNQVIIGAMDEKPEDDIILLRQGPDSNQGISDPHAYTMTEWRAFMQGVANHEFDPLIRR
jgi:hypothetical protein